ncbi:putative phage regluatory protein [Pectobacterium atrosepticum SCRI1043]|uniref:Phage regluatory protein n=1 Tax=Pectobacterium atrosepticum (strain SCRI 1043 / ATCC BAA-672) TaxID=218491 RepID=Q6D0V3_PECAS|nr:regulatory protein GemA [Pectobacterium atrosepticum]AIA72716.1 Rha family transcriptional regulator [Pectobacterium atrosepticum]AIK15699.1 putative phage regluatory protein [Pectobacterium atrosepticum]MCL6317830.1 regulatory protein GemA [Pectobacterium atrosepticum]MCL6322277.1 regulatory protein GemA [Pectobacterium atrosepticum]POW25431.1 GemA protein [Pectobacterium atrosepticum]
MTKNQLIKLIHIAKRDLQLDDDTYRQLLITVTGKTSTRDMTVPQLDNVLSAMKKRGFKIKAAKKANSSRPLDDSPQSRKIRSLWLEMADAGIIRDRSEAALARWVKRETGVDSLQWLNSEQASIIIEKLKQWQRRVRKPE